MLPPDLDPLLREDDGPGTLGLQHAIIWNDRLLEVEREALEAPARAGQEWLWWEGEVLHLRRVGRFPTADPGRRALDLFPLFLGAFALAGLVAVGGSVLPSSSDFDSVVEEDHRFVGQVSFQLQGSEDQNPEAGAGERQNGREGDPGAKDAAGELAEGAPRRTSRPELEGEYGLDGGDGPVLAQGKGRQEAVEGGLTSRETELRFASASEGELQGGLEGQVGEGAEQGADGRLAFLNGLASKAWRGKGLRGPGTGPGADRSGITDGADGGAWLKAEKRGFVSRAADPTSTFALEVDRASYTRARGALKAGAKPDPALIRAEEFVNAMPMGLEPGAWEIDLAHHPEESGKALLRVSLRLPEAQQSPPLDVVVLMDDSCSMTDPTKLGFAQDAVAEFVGGLGPEDRVRALSFGSDTVSEGRRQVLFHARGMEAGGNSPLREGRQRAYALAEDRCEGCRSAVVVLADGGMEVSDYSAQLALWSVGRDQDTALAILGFGQSGHDAPALEALALVGGGSLHFVDRPEEARELATDPLRLLGDGDPARLHVAFGEGVERWRLVGYENRLLSGEALVEGVFTVQAGSLGGGAAATALYELELGSGEEIASAWLRGGPAERPLGSVTSADLGEATTGTRVAWAAAGLADHLAGEEVDLAARRVGAAAFHPAHAELDELIELALRAD